MAGGRTCHAARVKQLALDAPRSDVLAHAAQLVEEAWASFDHARDDQPPVDDATRGMLVTGLPELPTPAQRVLSDAGRVLDESAAQPRPRWFGFVGSSGLEIGVIGDLLSATYDINLAIGTDAATLVERQALRWVGELVGYPGQGGSFTSGGMLSNLTALTAARERALPGSRRRGISGTPATIYCSSEAHYSIVRAAEVLGLGSDAVRSVPIDANRRARPEDIAAAIDADRAAGITPIAVIASAGTTLTGAVDPIAGLADVCAERDVWLHVDGAYGLPAAAAPSTKALFAGLGRADSVSVDAHKWLYLPKACSVVLVRDKSSLVEAFAHDESYMLHDEDERHAVDTTLEYSRPFRALKLWLALRTHGAEAFRAAIEQNVQQARFLRTLIDGHDDLEVIGTPGLSIVPFRHLPGDGRDIDAHNLALAHELDADGRVYVSPAFVDGVAVLRPCIVNFRTTDDDVRALVDVARELGARLLA
jgi:aromatic-L-amino-acid/L-tryptophan decarboxylase